MVNKVKKIVSGLLSVMIAANMSCFVQSEYVSASTELFKSTFWELWFNFSLPWWFLQIIKLS